MLTDKQGKRIDEYVSDYVLFDLETTGISVTADEIIEISAVKVVGRKVAEEFTSLVKPQRAIPYAASMVNGITDEMVADAPPLEPVLSDFLDFAGEHILVGHNICRFDMEFIYRDCRNFFQQIPGNDLVDTLTVAKACLPALAHHKLTDLAVYYGISTVGAHRALNDCRMNQQVFEHLGDEILKGTAAIKKCPRCGRILKMRNGRFGTFYGCSGYPECKYIENC